MTEKSRRLELQADLEEVLGTAFVYFQPPPDFKMSYPCIRYERDDDLTLFADNLPYKQAVGYLVTSMDYDPDTDVIEKLRNYPYSHFDRHYATSGLNHDVFVIYH